MTAQYRPYKDEETDTRETNPWTDNELGSIQIYEDTTEALPLNNKRKNLYFGIIVLSVYILGILTGFAVPHRNSQHLAESEKEIADTCEDLENFQTDPTIRDKLLEIIDTKKFKNVIWEYKSTDRRPGTNDDKRFAEYITKEFDKSNLDNVTNLKYQFKTLSLAKPSSVRLLNNVKGQIYSNIESEQYEFEDTRPFLPLSQSESKTFMTDQLIYINNGSKSDYAWLEQNQIILTNETQKRIFIMRHSIYQVHEAVISALEKNATAILLFPDPNIYGELSPFPPSIRLPQDAGLSYPSSWSDGSDLLAALMPGTSLEARLGVDRDAKINIPVIPISFKTAAKILQGLSGPIAPRNWNCFDFTLHTGPGYNDLNNDNRSQVEVSYQTELREVTSSTVTGVIVGSTEPDRYVIIGSRRDSLNRGALDSVSGTSVMLEVARVFGVLIKQGWRPRRSIIFNSFGAETLNRLGSNYWLEENQKILVNRGVAYINCDIVVTGNESVTIAASPILYQVLFNATKLVPNPNVDIYPEMKTVYDSWKNIENASEQDRSQRLRIHTKLRKYLAESFSIESRLPKENSDNFLDILPNKGSVLHDYWNSALIIDRPRVRPLDMHSIYSPYLMQFGIPVVDMRYTGYNGYKKQSIFNDLYPLLGSKYDSLETVTKVDPDFRYHKTIASLITEIVRSLSDSMFLPFNLLDYALTLEESFDHFFVFYKNTANRTEIDLSELHDAIEKFIYTAVKFHHKQDVSNLKDPLKLRKLNDQLMLVEKTWLDPSGLPNHFDRKHLVLNLNDEKGFPGLIDLISVLESEEGNNTSVEFQTLSEIVNSQYKTIIHTINNAVKVIEDVYIF